MLIAKRSFSAEYDGEVVEVTAGQTCVDASHELARSHAESFEPEGDRHPDFTRTLQRAENAQWNREPASRARPQLSVEDELRIRRERLEEIATRERQRPAAPSPGGEEAFWRGVDSLLERTDPKLARELREDREAMAQLDMVENARADAIRHEVGELSSWLDRG